MDMDAEQNATESENKSTGGSTAATWSAEEDRMDVSAGGSHSSCEAFDSRIASDHPSSSIVNSNPQNSQEFRPSDAVACVLPNGANAKGP